MKRISSLFLFLIIVSSAIFAQSNKEIRVLESKRKAMLEQIEVTNQLLKEVQATEKTSLQKLNLLTSQVQIRRQFIASLNEEVILLDKEIQTKERRISALSADLKLKQMQYGKSIQSMAKRNRAEDKLMFILSAEDFGQTYRRIRYLREFSISKRIQGKEVIAKKAEVEKEKEILLAKRNEKASLLSERQQEEAKLKKEEEAQRQEVNEIKRTQKGLQTSLKNQKAQADSFNKQIDKLIQDEIANAAAEAKKNRKKAVDGNVAQNQNQIEEPTQEERTSNARVADSQGSYAMTNEEKALSGSFESNQGKLPYPITGKAVITGFFGIQQNAEYRQVQTENIGIDIQGAPGAEARAVFDGTVSKIFALPGYNTSVMIRHGKYLTIYANLSQVYVKQGDKVKTRQSIGKVFADATKGNLPELHFQIRKDIVKLNPERWLAR